VTETTRETRVLGAVVTLVDSLLDDFDVVELLTDLTEQCTDLLDVAAAGLLLAGPRGDLHLLAATSEQSRDVEMFQLQADEGPCRDCYQSGQPVSSTDLGSERSHWPRFADVAMDAGFASVHAVPMRAAGTILGALGLFGDRPGQLSEADLLVAQTLAHVACVAILQEHPVTAVNVLPQLQSALAGRIVVEQAKGYLREVLGTSVEDAFALLRRYARSHGQHLTDVARRLISQPDERQPIVDALRDMAT
jgi:transcriptional regulator with GAF, ATPase, and Fis domain